MTSQRPEPLPRPISPLYLPHLIQFFSSTAVECETEESPEDIISSSLFLLDPFATNNQQGEPGTHVQYNARGAPPLTLALSTPGGAEARLLFAHYVWNAGILLAECIGSGWWWERLSNGRENVIDRAGEDDANGTAASNKAPQSTTFASAPFTPSNVFGPSASISAPTSESRTRTADWAVAGEKVLELGAGAGLAGLCAARAGARSVVLTDYPIPEILAALEINVHMNTFALRKPKNGVEAGGADQDPGKKLGEGLDGKAEIFTEVTAIGHEWGTFSLPWCHAHCSSFTRILAADTLWHDGAHAPQAASMAFFLAHSASARVWIVAGFHTGRAKVRHFLEEALSKVDLRIVDAWEVDVAGMERPWDGIRYEGPGEGARWSVIAIVGWSQTALGRFKYEESS